MDCVGAAQPAVTSVAASTGRPFLVVAACPLRGGPVEAFAWIFHMETIGDPLDQKGDLGPDMLVQADDEPTA